MSKEDSKKFRSSYGVTYSSSKGMQYDPNTVFEEIQGRSRNELSDLVKGTGNEYLIAFRDPKVRELVNYVIAAIIRENHRMTPPEVFFPFKIQRRFKSIDSLAGKMKKHDEITDYLGFKIVPESEHDIFYSKCPVTQEMIERRENTRRFVANKFKKLSKISKTSFESYCLACTEILDKLQEVFYDKSLEFLTDDTEASTKFASERRQYYEEQKQQLATYLQKYKETNEDSNEKLPLEVLASITQFDVKKLLVELQNAMSNEVTLFQLTENLKYIINNSNLLHSLGVSINSDPKRTKPKFKENGFRSNFFGLDLNIELDDETIISLPIECQIQTQEQYRDGNSGFSAHTKRPGKSRRIKPLPKIYRGKRFSDPKGIVSEYIEYLSFIQHITPEFAEASMAIDRVQIIPQDFYGELRHILQAEDGSLEQNLYNEHLIALYEKRAELFPSAVAVPIYISDSDMPTGKKDPFFTELSLSVLKTMNASLSNGEIIFNDEISKSLPDNPDDYDDYSH